MQLHLQKFAPSPDLQAYVRFYYTLAVTGEAGETLRPDNHPQGTMDMVFIMEPGLKYGNPGAETAPLEDIVVIGQQSQKFNMVFSPGVKVLGVTFTAEGFEKIFRLPMKEFTNIGVQITDLLDKNDRFLVERLHDLPDNLTRLQMLDDLFHRKIYQNDLPFDPVDHAMRQIRDAGGDLNVAELAEAYDLSVRTLQRRFKDKIGIGPKIYARIMRFNQVLWMLRQNAAADWQDILFSCGYYDQMHFIKEFKTFTGRTPSVYAKEDHELGNFFMEE